ncbi:MAG: YbaB/EbfC family nucleoid-associated protein [Actinomycetota bacterium]|nr:YbaB/EbfC family nucleoid-associated protein [Actinomycetota bacterium]
MTDQEPTRREPPETEPEAATPDFNQLLSHLGEVTSNLQAAQAQAAAQVVEGSAGGGAVRVRMTAGMEAESVAIDPSVIDPAEAELLGDLVLAALRDAVEHANQVQAEAMGGVGLGGAGGLLGL